MVEVDAALLLGEEGGVGFEGDLGAGVVGLADDLHVLALDAALEDHVVDLAVAVDFDLHPFGDEVDDGRADTVQPTGGAVGGFVVVVELAPGAEGGEDDLDGGDALGGDRKSTRLNSSHSS